MNFNFGNNGKVEACLYFFGSIIGLMTVYLDGKNNKENNRDIHSELSHYREDCRYWREEYNKLHREVFFGDSEESEEE